MSKLSNRINMLRELKDQLMTGQQTGISRQSYLELLDYHILLLKEVDKLCDAIQNNDYNGVQKFFDRRINTENEFEP